MSIPSLGPSSILHTQQSVPGDPREGPIAVDPAVFERVMKIMVSLQSHSNPPSNVTTSPTIFVDEEEKEKPLCVLGGQYTGDLEEGLPHGQGTMLYPRTHGEKWKKYTGEWREGKFNGTGLLTFWEGAYKQGEWKEGKLHGQGIWVTSDRFGREYEGEWVDGELQNGKISDATGYLYKGRLLHGKKHGQGTQITTLKIFYEGAWENDKMHGLGKRVLLRTGSEFEGEFRNDLLYTGNSRKRGMRSKADSTLCYYILSVLTLQEGKYSTHIKFYRFPSVLKTAPYRVEDLSEWIYFFEGEYWDLNAFSDLDSIKGPGLALHRESRNGPITTCEKGEFEYFELIHGTRTTKGVTKKIEKAKDDKNSTCTLC